MKTTQEILSFTRPQLEAKLIEQFGWKPFRARQIFQWLHDRRALAFENMTNVSKEARVQLAENFSIYRPTLSTVQQSKDGTRKYLFEVTGGDKIESVLIRQPKRWTLCVSSQVGCAIGCKFCRTALMGLKRNLETFEIVAQVLAVRDDVANMKWKGEPIEFGNIVFMGMGEPLHNLDNVINAVNILNDDLGLDFSSRKITVSTSGLVPAIKAFGASEAGANLAISLNATTNAVRDVVMPINKKYPLEKLLAALRGYPLTSRKRITIEYVMLHNVNDTQEDLARLPSLLRGIPSKVNLIPYNQNAGLGFKAPPTEWVNYWQRALLDRGVSTTVRWSKGDDISAACGQLATPSGRRELPIEVQ